MISIAISLNNVLHKNGRLIPLRLFNTPVKIEWQAIVLCVRLGE